MAKLAKIIVSFLFLFLVFSSPSYAKSVSISPSIDTYVYSAAVNASNENSRSLVSFWNNDPDNRGIILMKFPLDAVPNNATITGATLSLYQTEYSGINPMFLPIAALTENWNSNVTWNTLPQGSPMYAAVWLNNTNNEYKTWDVTDLVKKWKSNELSNYGLYIRSLGGGNAVYSRTFISNEGSADKRPKLVIDYTVPIPTLKIPVIKISPIVLSDPVVGNNVGVNNQDFSISDIKADAGFGSATITWKTDKAANSVVYYGKAQDGLNRFDLQTGQNDSTTSHSVILPALSPGTKYSYKVSSSGAGNVQKFGAISFFTTLSEASGDAYDGAVLLPTNTPFPTNSEQNAVSSLQENVENKVAEVLIQNSTQSAQATAEGQVGNNQPNDLISNNPVIMIASWAGTNRVAGIVMIVFGILSFLGAVIVFETGRRMHGHVKKIMNKKGGKK